MFVQQFQKIYKNILDIKETIMIVRYFLIVEVQPNKYYLFGHSLLKNKEKFLSFESYVILFSIKFMKWLRRCIAERYYACACYLYFKYFTLFE